MDLDSLQDKWQSLANNDADTSRLLSVAAKVMRQHTKSLQNRLRNRFLRSGAVCIMGMLLIVPLSHLLTLTTMFKCLYVGYFMLLLPLNLWNAWMIHRLDLCSIPMSEAVKSVITIKRRITLSIVAGLMLALPMMTITLATFADQNDSALIGGIIGGVIGVVIAVIRVVTTYHQINALREMFEE